MLLPQNDDKSFKRKRTLCVDSDRAANADHGDVSFKSGACL